LRDENIKLEVIFLEDPYPPCTLSLATLEPILLSELVMNSHHRGRVLLAKLVGINDKSATDITAGTEDISGDVEILNITYACMHHKAGHTWPNFGSWVAIKDPYLTLEEQRCEPCIRVSHPSDLVDAGSLPSGLSRKFGLSEEMMGKTQHTPLQCKEAGNAALTAKSFDTAHAKYTDGIRIFAENPDAFDQSVKQDLYRNRSCVRLFLGRYEGAVQDALAALTHKSDDKHKKLDVKAYFRAASASYKLKLFGKAARFLHDQLELSANDEDGLALLNRVNLRLREQDEGSYDVSAIEKGISYQNPYADAADYTTNTTIRDSGSKRGRGLFATRALNAGDLIMAETTFSCAWSHQGQDMSALACHAEDPGEIHGTLIGLWRNTIKEATNNLSKANALIELHSKYKGNGSHIVQVDDVAVIDTFQMYGIMARNVFVLSPIGAVGFLDRAVSIQGDSGLWIRMSYINHSCLSNSQKICHGNLALVYATRPIAKGEEIFLSYCGEYRDYDQSKKEMKHKWGFECDCRLCQADAKCSPAELAKRTLGWGKSLGFALVLSPKDARNSNLVAVLQRYVDRIVETYSNELYVGLPKTALVAAQSWLLEFYTASRDLPRIRQAMIDLLRALGFRVEAQGHVMRRVSHTVHSTFPEDGKALLEPIMNQVIEILTSGGNPNGAKALHDFAVSLEISTHGRDTGCFTMFQRFLRSPIGKEIAARASEQTRAIEKEMAGLAVEPLD
jgi:tetratricopeptide (TPR) repeat protein